MGDPDARWDRLHAAGPWVLDGLLALAAAGAGVALLATVLPFDPGSPRAWTAYLLVLAYTMPIAVRRLFPLPALAWALATGAAFAAAQQRTGELEQAREELARRAVTEERLRIARELHDVVAHSMSIIAVQSGVGAHVLDSQPEEASKALVAVEATSRQALVEMRRLLGVLRQEAEPRGALAPAPGLAGVEALAAEVARAGVRVEVRIEGTPAKLPAGLDLSGYRIALYGGTLEAGPLPGGGFRVAASLPLEEAS
jgi:signal transduction histidine kinase